MRWAELGTAVQSTIIGVFILLVLSTLVVWTALRVASGARLGGLTQRIDTWWLLAGFFCLAVIAGNDGYDSLLLPAQFPGLRNSCR